LIERPQNCHFVERRETSILYFDKGRSVEYDVRGGMCFPFSFEPSPGHFDYAGYSVLAGMDVLSGKITIFEQRPWVVVENIIGPDNALQYRGVAEWLNRCWSKYFGRRFYYHQPHELKRKYILEIIRSDMVNPDPSFISVPWGSGDEAEALHVVWKAVKLKTVQIERDTRLAQDLLIQKEGKDRPKYIPPSIHALMCVLMAYERFPWRPE